MNISHHGPFLSFFKSWRAPSALWPHLQVLPNCKTFDFLTTNHLQQINEANKLSLALHFPVTAGSSATVFPGKLLFLPCQISQHLMVNPSSLSAVGPPAFLCCHPWRAVANRIPWFSLTQKKNAVRHVRGRRAAVGVQRAFSRRWQGHRPRGLCITGVSDVSANPQGKWFLFNFNWFW